MSDISLVMVAAWASPKQATLYILEFLRNPKSLETPSTQDGIEMEVMNGRYKRLRSPDLNTCQATLQILWFVFLMSQEIYICKFIHLGL
jgi:hypothetical protein